MSKSKAYGFFICAGLFLVLLAFVQVAYANTSDAALAAKKAAIEVAEVQNVYQLIDAVEQPDRLEENAAKMDKHLSEDDRNARVPWYRMYGMWVYGGILQDTDGYPCVMWVCRADPLDSSSTVYAFATATYVGVGGEEGYFTNVKFMSTKAGVDKLPDVPSAENADVDDTQAVVDMIDEIREQTKDDKPIDTSGMADAAEERRQRKLNAEEQTP